CSSSSPASWPRRSLTVQVTEEEPNMSRAAVGEHRLQPLCHQIPIGKASQGIPRRPPAQFLIEPCVLHGGTEVAGKDAGDLLLVTPVRDGSVPASEKQSDRNFVAHDRHAQDRP